ncbi:MAG: glucosidase, partial [Vicinamibacterales bacterium]
HIVFAPAFWNGHDPILKERFFGLGGAEGNHGEDVKEYYAHLDATPTHSYMRALYKYPQAAFPYETLVEENARRGRGEPEFELADTGIFDDQRYFDIVVEYAKATPEDILVRITASNRGPDAAPLHVLPTVWFRNRWAWNGETDHASLAEADGTAGASVVELNDPYYGRRWLYCDGAPPLLFTGNETNTRRLFGAPGPAYAKDAFHEFVVHGDASAVDPARTGTKAAAHHVVTVPPGGQVEVRVRLTDRPPAALAGGAFGGDFAATFDARRQEADEFHAGLTPPDLGPDERLVMRQALAGLLWSKQYYHYVVSRWLDGDPAQPAPPPERAQGRNHDWRHLFNADVVSMPDTWEYPWYASWDLAFHTVPLALVDPGFAKAQLVLLLREWYMHPNGQLPAYEWALGDVNPPVHAWAAWRVYRIEARMTGRGDRDFLERVFQKLLLNFTWWVNRKDEEGNNVFEGGFLGLDNVGVFDRSKPLPTGGHLEQSDGTSWMAMYCLSMLAMASELARENPVYADVASKFWEHFLYIAHAMSHMAGDAASLWDDADGFFYDYLHLPDGSRHPLRVRSVVGLIPLLAVDTLEPATLARMPDFARRLEWFIDHRPDLTAHAASMRTAGAGERRLLAVVWPERLRRVLAVMLDEAEFLSPHGIRSLSRRHASEPYVLHVDGTEHRVAYEPGESTSGVFGGNSNWRGPVWFPINFLLIEALQRYHHYLGDGFRVECPTGSGRMLTLDEVAADLSHRLASLFTRGADGRRPVFGGRDLFDHDPHWRDLIPFHEYFHGDTGAGLGASHQTGWTALVAKLLEQRGRLDPSSRQGPA